LSCHRHYLSITARLTCFLLVALLFSACQPSHDDEVDKLNANAYAQRYRDLGKTKALALKALNAARQRGYDSGEAEAMNTLAFVDIAHMNYPRADSMLQKVSNVTDNEVELLISDIQLMRLCQRQSHNKDFYDYRERAQRRLRRIEEEQDELNDHEKKRMIYAFSEFHIVLSTYLYYMGLTNESYNALYQIDPQGAILTDTAQLLNYYYNIGSGGVLREDNPHDVAQHEMEYLINCYYMAVQGQYPYWEANSLQAMSEHLSAPDTKAELFRNNRNALQLVNIDDMPDSLLAGNLAQRSLDIFKHYGDVYQTAGGYRTLAQCYWMINDYNAAIYYLNLALQSNTVINRAPDLVASIREQLSLAYSAIDDKQQSDYNRNLYLDLQEQTRQDRLLEARAGQMNRNAKSLNIMLVAVVLMIVFVSALLYAFDLMRRRSDRHFSSAELLKPLEQWNERNRQELKRNEEKHEEVDEKIALARIHLKANRQRNMEQRAKIHLVNSIRPFIDRISNEVDRMMMYQGNEQQRKEQFEYVAELTDKINELNALLTHWIQLRQGELSLHIESFPLQNLFDVVSMSRMGFQLKGITLDVEKTSAVVKADKTLTLFMINTLADNARKFTQKGGTVKISAKELNDCVEVSVSDNGQGMTEEQTAHIFDHKPIIDSSATVSGNNLTNQTGQTGRISPRTPSSQSTPSSPIIPSSPTSPQTPNSYLLTPNSPQAPNSHGFGLMNCKGIIDKYHKVSRIFSVCSITAESTLGKGSTFRFRLPKGIARTLLALLVGTLTMFAHVPTASAAPSDAQRAKAFADSCYLSNIEGDYNKTLQMGDSVCKYLNRQYVALYPDSTWRIKPYGKGQAAEIQWFARKVKVNYQVILSMRNECAVAALALHKWALYQYNNNIYVQLYHLSTADSTLDNYVRLMQKTETNKNVAIALLALLLLCIFPAYYTLYYRHKIYDHICVERVGKINDILLSDRTAGEKIHQIDNIWNHGPRLSSDRFDALNHIVTQVRDALQKSIDANRQQQTSLELAEDELRRVRLEDDRMHVSNNVLDNCLSTLKHETMYYPSRIRQLIDSNGDNLQMIREVVVYYRELYALLSAQAMRAVGSPYADADMTSYLMELLKKHGADTAHCKTTQQDAYVRLRIPMTDNLSEQEAHDLFTPQTKNVDFLICRQIVRDMGEVTNLRASGIRAVCEEGKATIQITIPKKIYDLWINSK
jgi:signal transduction histidine kinase